jgi:hypothetical protein
MVPMATPGTQPFKGLVFPSQWIELAEENGKVVSWVQAAKTGRFVSQRYGRFELTEARLAKACENVNKLVAKNLIPVDYNHLSLHVERAQDAEAAGWIHQAELRAEGKELWVLVEWTAEAAQKIRDKKFRYTSPVIFPEWPDNENEGKSIGAYLQSMAITNTPFLSGMAPLALSNNGELVLTDVSMTDRQARVSQAVYDKFSGALESVWIREYFDDYVILSKDGKLFRLNYKLSDDLSVSFPDDATEVMVQYASLSEMPPMPEQKTPATDPQVLELTTKYEDLNRLVLTLQSDLTAAKTEAQTERERREQLENQMKEKDARALVLSLIQAGKLQKKQEEWAVSYALSDRPGFDKFATTLDPLVNLRKEHGSGESDEEVSRRQEADPVHRFMALCNDYIDKNGGKDKVKMGDAMHAVGALHPDLVDEYRASFVIAPTVQ